MDIERFIRKHKIDDTELNKVILNNLYPYDPTSEKKYLFWLYKLFLNEFSFTLEKPNWDEKIFPNITKALITLEQFPDRFKNANQSTDIYSYKEYEDLIKASEIAFTKGNVKTKLHKETDLVDEFDGIVILYPSSYEASCFYGRGTRWCTASNYNSAYDEYSANGYLFYILNRTSNNQDYKTALYTNVLYQVDAYNAEDDKMTPRFEDVKQIEMIGDREIIYPERVKKSILKYIRDNKLEHPTQIFGDVIRNWVKTFTHLRLKAKVVGGPENDYDFDIVEVSQYYNDTYCLGTYRVMTKGMLEEYLMDVDVESVVTDNADVIEKNIGKEKMMKYLDMDRLFSLMLCDDRLPFYDMFNIESHDEIYDEPHLIDLTDEMIPFYDEFELDPLKFFSNYGGKKIYYEGMKGILYNYEESFDFEKLSKDYPELIVDKKSSPIKVNFKGKDYYIINSKEDNSL
jgi:hypothetical protein